MHFLYGAALHRPGELPWTPVSRFFYNAFVIPTEPLGEWRNLILAFVKQGKLYFFKSRQSSRERRAFAAFATLLCQRHCVFLCKGTKAQEFSESRILGIVCRFSPWNVFPPMKPAFFFPNSALLNSGLWLGAFGKVWLFRCQSGIRRLWLTAFGKAKLFRCQSRSFRLTFWLPLQSGFA